MSDARVEAAAKAIMLDLHEHDGGGTWDDIDEDERSHARACAIKALAAADAAALSNAEGVVKRLAKRLRSNGTDHAYVIRLMEEAAATIQALTARLAVLEAKHDD